MNKIKATMSAAQKKQLMKKSKEAGAKRTRSEIASQKDNQDSSDSDGMDETSRPLAGKRLPSLSWRKFTELARMLKLSFAEDDTMMEWAFRLLEADNAMKEATHAEAEEVVEELEEAVDRRGRSGKDTEKRDRDPPFFRCNMSTVLFINGVDQIAAAMEARNWTQGLISFFRSAGVMIMDVWALQKNKDGRIVSALVKFATRFQKVMAVNYLNDERVHLTNSLGRGTQNRINARDAFRREQMEVVRDMYHRGWWLKKETKIDSYRIHNTGEEQPLFEVRTKVNGKIVWGPPPAVHTDTPPRTRREDRRTVSAARRLGEPMDAATAGGSVEGVEGGSARLSSHTIGDAIEAARDNC